MAATTTTSLPPQEHNDVDSALGSDTESLTQTITAENYRYRYLDNGRSIHPFESAGYLLPNDEREKHRLNFQHGIWLTTLDGRLYLAPLKQDIQNVLDVATGTGIWAMEFADKFPSAQVIGTDLSPMQPNLSVPPNCSFVVEDSDNSEWIFDIKFDFIHNRSLTSGWKNWPRYFDNCYKFLKPGGWLECHEFEMTMVNADDGSNTPPNNLCVEWSGFMRDGCMAGGVNPQCVSHFGEYLRNAGFIDIHKTLYRWPWCPWSDDPKEKEIGRMNAINQDASSMSLGLLTKNLGWSRERVEVYLTGVKKALLDTNLHTYVPVFIWWARKPEILEPNK